MNFLLGLSNPKDTFAENLAMCHFVCVAILGEDRRLGSLYSPPKKF